MAEFRKELSEAAKLKVELDAIYEGNRPDKARDRDAASHHRFQGRGDGPRVTNELDAVVIGTEGATETILASAEFIDETANTLSARLGKEDAELANDIQDKVIQIFEACNFQDLTGQRITKVVSTLRFVEDRIMQMMDIWGRHRKPSRISKSKQRELKEGDAALLNGPPRWKATSMWRPRTISTPCLPD